MLSFSQDLKFIPRNICPILMNANNDLLVRGELMDLEEITPWITTFIINPKGREDYAENPKMALINIRRHQGTDLEEYQKLCNAIQAAYDQIWNEAALVRYDKGFNELSNAQQTIIQKAYPKLVAENISTGFGTIELPSAPPPPPPPPPPVIRN